jgi:hypothetical protein
MVLIQCLPGGQEAVLYNSLHNQFHFIFANTALGSCTRLVKHVVGSIKIGLIGVRMASPGTIESVTIGSKGIRASYTLNRERVINMILFTPSLSLTPITTWIPAII